MNQIAPATSHTSGRLFYAVVAAISLGTGLVNALSTAQDALRRGSGYDLMTPLLWEMTSILVILLLLPVLLAGVRRMRRWPNLTGQIGFALATIVIFSGLHIAGMMVLRKLILDFAGIGYDFQLSLTTVIYEARKDTITALLIGSALWLFDSRRDWRPVDAAAGADSLPAMPQGLWLRDGPNRVRVMPSEIVWVGSAGNYIEYGMAGGARHLVRGTLAAAETQLAGFNIIRIHRTRLANLDRVTGLTVKSSGDFDLTFDTGDIVQGSRRYRAAVRSCETLDIML